MYLSLLYPGSFLSFDNWFPQNLSLNEVLYVNVWGEVNHRASELDSLLAATRRVRNFPAALASDPGLTFALTSFCGPNSTIPAS
jgi:hypothetical protein